MLTSKVLNEQKLFSKVLLNKEYNSDSQVQPPAILMNNIKESEVTTLKMLSSFVSILGIHAVCKWNFTWQGIINKTELFQNCSVRKLLLNALHVFLNIPTKQVEVTDKKIYIKHKFIIYTNTAAWLVNW